MKNKVIFCLLIVTVTAWAQNPSPNQEIPSTMVQFWDEIESLQPLMVSKKQFADTKNEFNIQTRLNHLSDISKHLKHEPRLSTPFFQVMTDMLPKHLTELKESFKSGDKEHARFMLNATLDGCSSCHSQVKSNNAHLWNFQPETVKGNNFEKAEFLFAVRQYDEALPLYRKVVSEFKPTSIEPINQDVQDALFRKQSILVRSKRNLSEAQQEIENDIGKTNLPEPIKVLLRSNLASLKEMQKINIPNVAKAKSKDVEQFAAIALSKSTTGQMESRNAIPQMFVSGVLYDFVQQHSTQDIGPGIYYWLAKCEKRTTNSYFFPLAEFYLMECINRYPLSPEAKLCFNDLENMSLENLATRR